MTAFKKYILNELRVLQRECMEKSIPASEWIKRYAEEYRRNYDSSSNQKRG